MVKPRIAVLPIAAALLLASGPVSAITLGQLDSFDSGTAGWRTGGANPNPPFQRADGGPQGAGDGFLVVRGNGGSGSGSNLVAFNTDQWTGDYLLEGVTAIKVDLNDLGSSNLEMRLLFEGPGGGFLSAESVSLAAGSGWQTAVFPIGPAALVGGSGYVSTLGNVSKLRIVHAPTLDGAEPILGELGLDNVAAVPEPRTGALVALGLALLARRARGYWHSSCARSAASRM